MAFEQTVLAVAKDCGFDGAYFAYGTLWVPAVKVTDKNLMQFSETFPSISAVPTEDEVAIDFTV